MILFLIRRVLKLLAQVHQILKPVSRPQVAKQRLLTFGEFVPPDVAQSRHFFFAVPLRL